MGNIIRRKGFQHQKKLKPNSESEKKKERRKRSIFQRRRGEREYMPTSELKNQPELKKERETSQKDPKSRKRLRERKETNREVEGLPGVEGREKGILKQKEERAEKAR